MSQSIFEISKILQIYGIKSESRHTLTTNKKSRYQKGKLTSGGLHLVHGISNRADVSTVHQLMFHTNLIPPITYLAQFSE